MRLSNTSQTQRMAMYAELRVIYNASRDVMTPGYTLVNLYATTFYEAKRFYIYAGVLIGNSTIPRFLFGNPLRY